MHISYPFMPKSSLSLTPGDFWGFTLKNGSWACGRVLQLRSEGRNSRMWFFGALLDWNGESQPTAEAIAGAKAFRQGAMHVDSIRRTGVVVAGNRSLALDEIAPWLCIDGNVVRRGYEYVRPWKRKDTGVLPTFGTWADLYIWCLANYHFAGYLPPDGELPTLPEVGTR